MSKIYSLKARTAFYKTSRRDFVVTGLGLGGLTIAAFGTPRQATTVATSANQVTEHDCVLPPEETEGSWRRYNRGPN